MLSTSARKAGVTFCTLRLYWSDIMCSASLDVCCFARVATYRHTTGQLVQSDTGRLKVWPSAEAIEAANAARLSYQQLQKQHEEEQIQRKSGAKRRATGSGRRFGDVLEEGQEEAPATLKRLTCKPCYAISD